MKRNSLFDETVPPVETYWSPADDCYYGKCPICEAYVRDDDNRCPKCGAKLDWWGEE